VRRFLLLVNSCLFLIATGSIWAQPVSTASSAVSSKAVSAVPNKTVKKTPSQKPAESPIILPLEDAIFLALRNNPTIKSTELTRITQKYAVVVARHQFQPNYSLSGSYTYTETTSKPAATNYGTSTSLTPAVSLQDVYGTTFTATMTNVLGRYYNPALALQILQPILRGFGRAVTEAGLRNALDSEEVNKLMLKKSVSTVIVTIISDYFNWAQRKASFTNDQNTLVSYERNVANDLIKYNAGRIAKNDLVQDYAQVAKQKVTLEDDSNAILQARFQLLKDMGLDADTPIQLPSKFDYDEAIRKFKGPYFQQEPFLPLEKCQELAFINDPNYAISQFGLRSAQRNLTVAEDNMRWQLNLTASSTRGGGSGGDGNAGIESIFNAKNHVESVGLALNVPIDDVQRKASYLGAKVSLQQAEISFHDLKRQIEINVFNQRNTILSNYKKLLLNKDSVGLQRQTVEVAQLKHDYGKLSSFELIKDQESLLNTENQYIASEIGYLQSLRDLNETLGVTLDVWGIKLQDFDHAKVN